MPFQFLLTRRTEAVEHLTLNRPDVRNAFDDRVIAELTAWAEGVSQDAARGEVRAVVVAGAGRVFSAGADLAWMARMKEASEDENRRDAMAAALMFARLDQLPVPLIARIHGAALGGGCGLAAVCDIVVAEETAVFGFTEVKVGILPATIAPFVLAKIGRAAARELFLTGARFPAARAREIGLVQAVVPAARLDDAVDAYVRELLSGGPEAITAAKALIPAIWAQPVAEALPLVAAAIAARRVSEEGQEGLRAFLEKRPPRWTSLAPVAPPEVDEHRRR